MFQSCLFMLSLLFLSPVKTVLLLKKLQNTLGEIEHCLNMLTDLYVGSDRL